MTAESSSFSDFVLSGLRVTHIQARLLLNEIEAAGIALKSGLITADDALALVAESGGMHLFPELTRLSS